MLKVLLVFLFISLPNLAVSDNKILLGVGDPWPVLLNPDTQSQGLITELVRTALLSQGYQLKMDFVPWSRAMITIKENNADLLMGAWYTAERNEYLLYSEPVFSSAIIFVKRISSEFEYQGIDSLSGKQVGTIASYRYDTDFLAAKNFAKITSDTLLNNILNLLAGRIDLTLDDQYVLEYVLDDNVDNWREKLTLVKQALAEKNIYIAINRSHPHSHKIISAFNKGLAAIKESGVYDRIILSHGI